MLIQNTSKNIKDVTTNVKLRHAVHCFKADQEYGKRIVKALHFDFEKVSSLSKLSEKI